ncbi:MAG: histidine phosphatase family protein [Frankiaceae bacterium]|nr:histidine phosphatase family protein [Frankiaceae bacterium]
MPAVLLVRHGQASFGADDYDVLSEVGREQSAHVGAELARRRLRSPVAGWGSLRRQRDTAQIAVHAAGLAVNVVLDPRWNEYDHLDLLKRYVPPDSAHDGTSKGLQALLDLALAAWVEDDHGDWAAFAGGARAALDELAAGLPSGRDAVVFTSGGVIAAVCGGLLGLGADGVVALNRVTANGAITKVVVGSRGASLISFNDHAHFEGDARRLLTYR